MRVVVKSLLVDDSVVAASSVVEMVDKLCELLPTVAVAVTIVVDPVPTGAPLLI